MVAQEYTLSLQINSDTDQTLPIDLDYPQKITTAQLTSSLEKVITQLHNAGYFSASIDSIFSYDSTYLAQVYTGRPVQWLRLDQGNIPSQFLTKVGFKQQFFKNKALNYNTLNKLQNDLLTEAENNGYPFATIKLDSISEQKGQFSARLNMRKGTLVTFDQIIIEGNADIKLDYLSNYLGIKPGDIYSKQKILDIPNRLKELPFLSVSKAPDITFFGDKAILNLALEKKKASRFDFIVGLLPNTLNEGGAEVRRFTITGDFKGELYNPFGAGEYIQLQLEQLRPATPKLDLNLNYPYLFGLPFGVDAQLNFFKQDTAFLNVQLDVGVQVCIPHCTFRQIRRRHR